MIDISTITKDGLIELMNKAGIDPCYLDSTRHIIWSVDDVLSLCPDLKEYQALEVLDYVIRKHDTSMGISLDTIDNAINVLFPEE